MNFRAGNPQMLFPGAARIVRRGPWLLWPMLIVSVGLLVWVVADGDTTGRILLQASQVLLWITLLINNRSAWSRHQEALRENPPNP